jgi:predicted lipoprotein with Yx(FWY)xxD motif
VVTTKVPATASAQARARFLEPWHVMRFAGGALLAASGAVHLDLYLTGYNTIPAIGWLFLIQVISAFALAVATFLSARRVLSAAGGGFLLSTFVGYLLALHVSLFGFREVRTTAGTVAGVIEIVGFAALVAVALRPAQSVHSTSLKHPAAVIRSGRWAGGALALLAALSLALSLASSGTASTTSGGKAITLRVTHIHGTAVLANARGHTLYWFAPDTPTASHCTSTCAAYWPPVIGSASTDLKVVGTFATAKRSNGALQVTYNGHPLYTYVGDSAPGQASGNDIKLNGGFWYEMKISK